MPYFAAALVRRPTAGPATRSTWTRSRTSTRSSTCCATYAEGGTALFFLEENDEYLAIVRVDGDGDPRTFISDGRAVGTSTWRRW